jgi:hypothetical protein
LSEAIRERENELNAPMVRRAARDPLPGDRVSKGRSPCGELLHDPGAERRQVG